MCPVSRTHKAVFVHSSLIITQLIICCILCSQEFSFCITSFTMFIQQLLNAYYSRHSLGLGEDSVVNNTNGILINCSFWYPGENALLLGKEDWKRIPVALPPFSRAQKGEAIQCRGTAQGHLQPAKQIQLWICQLLGDTG